MKSKLFALFFIFFSVNVIGQNRMGVLLPETSQLQQAIKAAARTSDVPLPEPNVEITVPSEIVTQQDSGPSEIEKNVEEDLDSISLEERIQNQSVQFCFVQIGFEFFLQEKLNLSLLLHFFQFLLKKEFKTNLYKAKLNNLDTIFLAVRPQLLFPLKAFLFLLII